MHSTRRGKPRVTHYPGDNASSHSESAPHGQNRSDEPGKDRRLPKLSYLEAFLRDRYAFQKTPIVDEKGICIGPGMNKKLMNCAAGQIA